MRVIHSVINGIGIFALIIGLAEVQQLDYRAPGRNRINLDNDFDMILVRFTSVFSLIYIVFTIITGHYGHKFSLTNIIAGVVYMMFITLQIALIYSLKNRVHDNFASNRTPSTLMILADLIETPSRVIVIGAVSFL